MIQRGRERERENYKKPERKQENDTKTKRERENNTKTEKKIRRELIQRERERENDA